MSTRRIHIQEITCDACQSTTTLDIDPNIGHRVKPAGWVLLAFHEKLATPHAKRTPEERYANFRKRHIGYTAFDLCPDCAKKIRDQVTRGK